MNIVLCSPFLMITNARNNRIIQRILVGMCLGFEVLAARAQANETNQTLTTGPRHIDFPQRIVSSTRRDTDSINVNFSLNKFDSTLGQLNSVQVGYAYRVDPSFTGTILVTPSIAAGLNANMDAQVSASPIGAATPISYNLFFNASGTFTRNNQTIVLDYSAQALDSGLTSLPESANAIYEGSGTLLVPCRLNFVQEATISNTGMNYQFMADYLIELRVVYNYTPLQIIDFERVGPQEAILTWTSKPNSNYLVQATKSLASAQWTILTNITAIATNTSSTVTFDITGQRFFRIGL